ncbi:hypothetical protein EST38_g9200 [Candolleomyces aberdarensis]|uniref:BTB domain-containing protein n=1 Tax=Candolleomyces aberdarensis TaxID=2316362 RepID=A0A4Q2DDG6_9AGAR|nr:hypothetical protein EST38_g9200 [Candolleomyces aberdarensis]
MSRTSNGSGLDGSLNNFGASPTTPLRDGKERRRYILHHDKYYMVGGDLFVLIDDVMFKIHSYFFKREARNFFDDVPAGHGPVPPLAEEDEGRSEAKAIRILDVTVEEFEHFLWVFYNPSYSIYDAEISSWFSILKLAHRWDFPMVKDFALRELERRQREVSLVKRIRLYHDYEAPPEYLVPLYGELCARDLTPTADEAVELGFEQMYRVFKARELLRSTVDAGADCPLSPLRDGMTEEETYPTVAEVFGLPMYAPPEGNDSNDGGESHRQAASVDESQTKDGVPNIKAPKNKNKKDKQKKHEKN